MIKPLLLAAAGVLAVGGAAGLWTSQHPAFAAAPVTASAKAGANGTGHHWQGHRMGRRMMADLAQALGISTATLRLDGQSGESIAAIAGQNHVTVANVENTLLSDAKSAIQSEVSAGKMTAAQATKLETRLGSRIDAWVAAPAGSLLFHVGRGPRMGFRRALLRDTASTLNMSTTALRQALQAGQSPGAIAKAHGSTAAALASALESDITAALQKKVSAGAITSTQEANRQAALSQDIAVWVNGVVEPQRPGPGFMPIAMGGLMRDAASALNMPTAALEKDLRSGQSLAAIAGSDRVSTLESTLLKKAKQDIQTAEKSGRLNPQMASRLDSHLSQMVDHFVTGSGHPRA